MSVKGTRVHPSMSLLRHRHSAVGGHAGTACLSHRRDLKTCWSGHRTTCKLKKEKEEKKRRKVAIG